MPKIDELTAKEIAECIRAINEEIEKVPKRLEEQKAYHDRARGVIHPSEIWGCLRKSYYVLKNYEPDSANNAKAQMIFDTGSAIHEQLETYFKNTFGDKFEAEIDVSNTELAQKLGISGHADGLLTLDIPYLGTTKIVIEFKTIRNEDFKKLKKPLDSHQKQVNTYARLLEAPLYVVFYYNKNDSTFKYYVGVFDEDLWQKTLQRVLQIRSAALSDNIPEKSKNFMECRTCPFRERCKEDG